MCLCMGTAQAKVYRQRIPYPSRHRSHAMPILTSISQADLDLGNYERFLDVTLTRDNNLTTGKVYQVRQRASELTGQKAAGEC